MRLGAFRSSLLIRLEYLQGSCLYIVYRLYPYSEENTRNMVIFGFSISLNYIRFQKYPIWKYNSVEKKDITSNYEVIRLVNYRYKCDNNNVRYHQLITLNCPKGLNVKVHLDSKLCVVFLKVQ